MSLVFFFPIFLTLPHSHLNPKMVVWALEICTAVYSEPNYYNGAFGRTNSVIPAKNLRVIFPYSCTCVIPSILKPGAKHSA